jgi:hypothetical protein
MKFSNRRKSIVNMRKRKREIKRKRVRDCERVIERTESAPYIYIYIEREEDR